MHLLFNVCSVADCGGAAQPLQSSNSHLLIAALLVSESHFFAFPPI